MGNVGGGGGGGGVSAAAYSPLFQMLGPMLMGAGAAATFGDGGGGLGVEAAAAANQIRQPVRSAGGAAAAAAAGMGATPPILQEILSNIVGMQFADGMPPPHIQILAPEMQVNSFPVFDQQKKTILKEQFFMFYLS